MKPCFKCKETKPYTEFYKHSAMGDGYLNKCKACTKKDVNEHRAANVDRIREYDRRRFLENPSRRMANALNQIKMRKKYPEKEPARQKTYKAIKAGLIVKTPCEKCGDPNSEIHHLDYSDHMNVMFLCKIHHEEWHVIHGDFLQ